MKRILIAVGVMSVAVMMCQACMMKADRMMAEPPMQDRSVAAKSKPAPTDFAAPAMDAPEKPARHAKAELDFQDDLIEGDLKKPDGEYAEARNKVKHSNPVPVREHLGDDGAAKQPKDFRAPAALDETSIALEKQKAGDRAFTEDGAPKTGGKPNAVTTPPSRDPNTVSVNGQESGAKTPKRMEETETGVLLQHYGVNPTIDTAAERVSTFAADVDTGSYTLARSYLERDQLPPEAAVRVEEFVNAFDYGYRGPEKEAFAVSVEAFPSPYRKGYHVLHLGLKGREVKASARKSANLVFVIDVSGSMDAANRLPMAKRAMGMMVEQLREDDTVAIVVYGTNAHTVLEPTSASQKSTIIGALDSLRSEGSTNVQAGLELGYTVALKRFKGGGINRVILCSDGVANNGITEADGIFKRVKGKASEGITLTTVGFGMGSYNDVLMERLADQGDGQYAYVDKLDEARRIFVDQLTSTLEVIAKDVKLQLEFNPEAVERYRLLGFENRALKKEDFANDKIDAGEIGAGHSVTAIYEVKFRSRSPKSFATFRARFKQPQGGASALVEKVLPMDVVRDSLAASTGPTRMSLVAAGFAEKLRGSYWARNLSWDELLATWETLPEPIKDRQQARELRTLILTAKRLDKRPDKWEREMPIAQMDFDRIPVLR